MDVTPDRFRLAMGHFATGVTVVTTLDGDRPQGITVNALSSVSLEPPLVLVALDRRRFITPTVIRTGRYAVSILGEGADALSDCFAGADVVPDRDAFCGAPWHPGALGLPILDAAVTALECTVVQTFEAGDHDLFVGRVEALHGEVADEEPLLYYRRRYRRLDPRPGDPAAGRPEHRLT